MALPTYDIELTKTTQLARSTIQLSFRVNDDDFIFEAGQFVSLRFAYENSDHKRSYSIACSPEDFRRTGEIEIALGNIPGGRASECFKKAAPGDLFTLAGPAGVLTLPEELPERLVLVGTGTGVAPYRAMLPALIKALDQGVSVHIIMGVRQREDLFYNEDFESLAAVYDSAHYDICFSREAPAGDPDVGDQNNTFHGYVQSRLPGLELTPGKDLIFLCGNPPMIDDALPLLKAMGFNNKQLRREKYTFSR